MWRGLKVKCSLGEARTPPSAARSAPMDAASQLFFS
jgi:hypothetical protein